MGKRGPVVDYHNILYRAHWTPNLPKRRKRWTADVVVEDAQEDGETCLRQHRVHGTERQLRIGVAAFRRNQSLVGYCDMRTQGPPELSKIDYKILRCRVMLPNKLLQPIPQAVVDLGSRSLAVVGQLAKQCQSRRDRWGCMCEEQ